MPRFHLHLYNRTGCARDEEGAEAADLRDAARKAIDGIRGILSEEVRRGTLDLHGRVEVVSPDDELLRTVRFSEAVEVRPDSETG